MNHDFSDVEFQRKIENVLRQVAAELNMPPLDFVWSTVTEPGDCAVRLVVNNLWVLDQQMIPNNVVGLDRKSPAAWITSQYWLVRELGTPTLLLDENSDLLHAMQSLLDYLIGDYVDQIFDRTAVQYGLETDDIEIDEVDDLDDLEI